VVVLGAAVSDTHLAELRDVGVSYLVIPDDDIDLSAMLDTLSSRLPIKKTAAGGRCDDKWRLSEGPPGRRN
jgi:riboflavin biosynthesis pyrimidine reductase